MAEQHRNPYEQAPPPPQQAWPPPYPRLPDPRGLPPQPADTGRGILAVTLAVVGGVVGTIALLLGLFVWFLVGLQDAVTPDEFPGSRTDRLAVEVGEEFEIRDFTYADGWTIERTALGLTVRGLQVTNGRDEAEDADLTVVVSTADGSPIGEVDCPTATDVPPGGTRQLACLPDSYARADGALEGATVEVYDGSLKE